MTAQGILLYQLMYIAVSVSGVNPHCLNVQILIFKIIALCAGLYERKIAILILSKKILTSYFEVFELFE
jgi:hypothetical protein